MAQDSGMNMEFGGSTAAENLDRAIRDGEVLQLEDGRLALRDDKPYLGFVLTVSTRSLPCHFLRRLMFFLVYAKAAIPAGCQACYKVKITVPTMAATVALHDFLQTLPYLSKCGIDLFNPHSRDIWAGYVYLTGLEEARAAYAVISDRLRDCPELRDGAKLTIKRGCSSYEAALGPSDTWTFRPEQQELEASLINRFQGSASLPPAVRRGAGFVRWLRLAHSIGDDSYLRFTGGKPLYPPSKTYDP